MILITGSTGLLGSTLTPYLKSRGLQVVTHARLKNADYLANLSNKEETFSLLDKIQPKIIINLVSLTSVEECQDRPNAAYLSNTLTVENLTQWIMQTKADCHLIQISTDHVYDGIGPHSEDQVTLTNNYASSKYAGELAATRVHSTVIRTNFVGRSKVGYRDSLTDWVYNSLTRGEDVRVLRDVFFSPLSMITLTEMILLVLEKKPLGIYNLGSHEGMSKAEFDFSFAENLGLQTKTMIPIDCSQATFLRAYRPKDMRMNCLKFENTLGVKLPLLEDEIKRVAKEYHDEA
jgi:dTDP-4-dehydrorhamnose reductase